MQKLFSCLIVLFLCSACSSVEINTAGNELYYVANFPESNQTITKETTVDFYFWGLVPQKDTVVISKLFEGEGVYNPAFISVNQRISLSNFFFTAITLGLYSPVTIEVSLKTQGKLK